MPEPSCYGDPAALAATGDLHPVTPDTPERLAEEMLAIAGDARRDGDMTACVAAMRQYRELMGFQAGSAAPAAVDVDAASLDSDPVANASNLILAALALAKRRPEVRQAAIFQDALDALLRHADPEDAAAPAKPAPSTD